MYLSIYHTCVCLCECNIFLRLLKMENCSADLTGGLRVTQFKMGSDKCQRELNTLNTQLEYTEYTAGIHWIHSWNTLNTQLEYTEYTAGIHNTQLEYTIHWRHNCIHLIHWIHSWIHSWIHWIHSWIHSWIHWIHLIHNWIHWIHLIHNWIHWIHHWIHNWIP
jgi:hypothetical protein